MYYKYTITKYDLTQWKNYFRFLHAYFRHTRLLNFKNKNFIGKQIKINWLYPYFSLFLVWKILFYYIYWVKFRRLKKIFWQIIYQTKQLSKKYTYFDSCYPPWWSPETQASGCRVHSSSRGCSGPRGNNPRPRD